MQAGEEVNLVDTHVHTLYSDGAASPGEVEDRCLDQRIGCCITDHNEIRGSIWLLERQKVPTMPSIELGSQEKIEIMLFFRRAESCESFFKEHVEPYRRRRFYAFLPRPLDYLIAAASEHEALISVPHPFAPLWKNIEYGAKRRISVIRTIEHAQCIEVWNGRLTHRANRRAQSLCGRLSRLPLGGSDSHEAETIGSVVVAFESGATSDSMYQAIADGRISGIWGQNKRPNHLANTWQLVMRHSQKLIAPSCQVFMRRPGGLIRDIREHGFGPF